MATLFGTPDDDVLIGRGFQNTIIGFNGDDILIGGDHSDVLHGREGNDILIGGEGADIFSFGLAESPNYDEETRSTLTQHDTVADFDLESGDVLDLPFGYSAESFDRHNVSIQQDGNDTIIYFTGDYSRSGEIYHTENTITLTGIQADELTESHMM